MIETTVHGDERGSFARVWCEKLFADQGIEFRPVQGNSSVTQRRGTLRGMHFQRSPKADPKIVRCSHGRVYDVIVDLREHSPTCGEFFVNELSGDDGRIVFIPAGFAHGFQTLSDLAIVEYLMGVKYVPALADGFRYDDPAIAIPWPGDITAMSENDTRWPPLAGRMPWLADRAK